MNINRLINLNIVSNISRALKTPQETDFVDDAEMAVKNWNETDKIQNNACPRWDLDKIPLTFFINRNVQDEKFIQDFVDAAKSAFQVWSRASYGLIRFQEVTGKNNADIILDWSNKIVFGRDFEVGENDLKVVNNIIQKAEITIIIYPIIDSLASSSSRIERVRKTALHETGHALGLNHSNNHKDIMFHRGINNKTLSSNDIRRLNELYNFKKPVIIT